MVKVDSFLGTPAPNVDSKPYLFVMVISSSSFSGIPLIPGEVVWRLIRTFLFDRNPDLSFLEILNWSTDFRRESLDSNDISPIPALNAIVLARFVLFLLPAANEL